MNKVAVVYWSGTGNTEIMAARIAQGAESAGAQVCSYLSSEFSGDMMDEFDTVAFGCPSMGAEELESLRFAPMFESCRPKLKGKRIALFGSYGWGDGQWMRDWEENCISDGAVMVADYVICNETPDSETETACFTLGKALA